MFVVARIPYEASFEEGDVEDGRVEVYELEDEDLEREVVFEFGLRPVHFWRERYLH